MKNILTPIISRLASLAGAFAPAQAKCPEEAGQVAQAVAQSNDEAQVQQPTPLGGVRKARKSRDTTEYAVGERIQGQVSGIERYGVFVRLPNCESGLVFHSEVAWPGQDVELHVGDRVEVVVLSFKPGRGLALSIKQAKIEQTFDEFVASHPIGACVDGRIKSVLDYGVFVTLTPGVDGLLHVSQLPAEAGNEPNAQDSIPRVNVSLDEQGKVVGLRRSSSQPDLRNFGKETIGQPIKVRLCAVDRGNRRISLELAS